MSGKTGRGGGDLPKEVVQSSTSSSSLPKDTGNLVMHHSTGIHGPINSNCEFITMEETDGTVSEKVHYLAVPVGQHLSLMHLEESGRSRFLPKKNISIRETLAMTVAPNRKLMALCERVANVNYGAKEKEQKEGGEGNGSDDEENNNNNYSNNQLNSDELYETTTSGDSSHDKPSQVISIYHIPTSTRVKAIPCPREKGYYHSLAFTGDSKYLVGATEGREAVLTVWLWDKETIKTQVYLDADFNISRVKCAPIGSYGNNFLTQISTSGRGHLRLWPVPSDGVRDVDVNDISLIPQGKEIKENFIDHQWVKGPQNERKLIAVADTPDSVLMNMTADSNTIASSGNVSTSECASASASGASLSTTLTNGEGANKKLSGRPTTIYIFQSADHSPYLELKQQLINLMPIQARLTSFLAHSKGILVFGSPGYVGVYDKTDDRKEPYVFLKTFIAENRTGKDYSVHSLALHPNRDTIAAITKENHVLSLNLSTLDSLGDHAQCPFQEVIQGGYHEDSIVAMDIGIQRPLIATAGSDGSVRIWNYLNQSMEVVSHKLNISEDAEITSLAMHPDGFHLLVGYKDCMKYYNILIDSLHLCEEKNVKHCKKLVFSSSGSILAAGSGLHVTIYNVVNNFSIIATFPGHIGVIKDLVFAQRDTILFSAGADGNIFAWNMSKLSKMEDPSGLEGPVQYTSIDVKMTMNSSEMNRIAACTEADGQIKMFSWWSKSSSHGNSNSSGNNNSGGNDKDSGEVEITDINISPTGSYVGIPEKDQIKPTYVCISTVYNLLVVGLSNGNVRSYPWPLQKENQEDEANESKKNDYVEVALHNAPVVRLKFTADESRLISVGKDGSVFVIVMQLISGGIEENVDYSGLQDDTAMINSGFYMVTSEYVDDLKNKVRVLDEDLKTVRDQNEYDLSKVTAELNNEIKMNSDEAKSELSRERGRFDELQSKYEKMMVNNMHQTERKDTEFAREIRGLEDQYEHKLSNEMDRYDRVCEDITLLKEQYTAKLEEDKKKHQEFVKEMESKHNKTELNLRHQIEKLMEESKFNDSTYREVLDQQEGEYEKEIKTLIATAETEIYMERDNTTKVRTAGNIVKTNLERLRMNMEKIEQGAKEREEKLIQERSKNRKLEATLTHLEKHLEERNVALLEKERNIMDMRNNTRTLENFRYVLDHRLKQLMEERGPVTQHIEKLENHIRSMYDDLVEEFNKKKETAKVIESKETKERLLAGEVHLLRGQIRTKESLLDRIEHDIGTAVALTAPKESVEAVKDLYRKYVKKEKQITQGVSNTELISKAKQVAGEYQDSSSNRKGHGRSLSTLGGGGSNGQGDNNTNKHNSSDNHNNSSSNNLNNSNLDSDSGMGGDGNGGSSGAGKSRSAAKNAINIDYLIAGLNESTRQREYMEKKTKDLQKINQEVNRESEKSKYRSIYENTELINQCNELRKTNVELKRDLGKWKNLCELNGINLENAGPATVGGGNGGLGASLFTASTSGSLASASEGMGPEESNSTFSPFQSNLHTARTMATTQSGKTSAVSTAPGQSSKSTKKATSTGNIGSAGASGGSRLVKANPRGDTSGSRRSQRSRDGNGGADEEEGGRHPSRGSNREVNAVANLEGEILALSRDLDTSSREVSMYKIEVARLRRVIQDINNQKISSGNLLCSSNLAMAAGMAGGGMRDLPTRPSNKHIPNPFEGGSRGELPASPTTMQMTLPQVEHAYVSRRNNDLHDVGLIKKVSLQPRPTPKKI